MSLYRVIYTSRPFGYDSAMLSGILLDARRANVRDGITGALICRADIYIQMLEGPEDQVRRAMDRIKRDDRHVEVTLQMEKTVHERMFGEWAMLHDPAVSWIWSREDIASDRLERATPDEVEGFFLRLRENHAAPDEYGRNNPG